MTLPEHELATAVETLQQADPVLSNVIELVGPCRLKLRRHRYQVLVRSIISQQISTAAARSIERKLRGVLSPHRVSSLRIAALSDEQLRSAGLSPQKVRYLRELTNAVESGELNLKTIHRLDDESVIDQLIQVKGIGRWTAQMFLMFCLGRMDVFPFDDLGIRKAIQNLYGFDDLPTKPEAEEIAQHWAPYSTIACWYCWRSLEIDN